MNQKNHHKRAPTADEINNSLTKDFQLHRTRNEPADKAIEANKLGARLRGAVMARYPPTGVRTANARFATKLIPAVMIALTLVVSAAVVWAGISFAGVAVIPYFALIAVLIACGYQQYRIENLELQISEINVLNDALSGRVNDLEAIVKAPERQAILDAFEEWRSSPTRGG